MRARTAVLAVAAAAGCLVVAPPATAALPVINYTLAGTAGAAGWFVSRVTVNWSVNFQGTPVSSSGCEAAVAITADTTGTTRTCSATNTEGTTTAVTSVIRIDTVPPAVTAAGAARPPDVGGFYRAPVGVAWSGSDATSGVESCTSLTFAGPDGPASLVGTCRDKAGNTSAPQTVDITYDATPPALANVVVAGGDALATVRWAAGADAQAVTVSRAPGVGAPSSVVFRGTATKYVDTGLRNGVSYTYVVTATDAAGNASTASGVAVPRSQLLSPAAGVRVSRPPLLRWKRVARAHYYNVQLFRGGRKVLSAWPSHPRLRLHRAWRFHGRRYRLRAGAYRWYVWPGYGKRARRNYGRLLGTRSFTVARRRGAR